MKQECENEKKNCRERWLVILLLLIFSALLIIIGIMLFGKDATCGRTPENCLSSENSGGGVGLVIDPNSNISQSSQNDKSEEQGVAICGRGSMTIPANEREITVDFYNPDENAGLYYLTFELRLCDDSQKGYEVLYTSGLVEPGMRVDHITLSHELEKGVYKAVIHVQPYRMNREMDITNNADMETELIVV